MLFFKIEKELWATMKSFIMFLGKQTTGPTFSSAMLTDKTALGTSPAAADTFLIYDEDAGALKKVAYSNVPVSYTHLTMPTNREV